MRKQYSSHVFTLLAIICAGAFIFSLVTLYSYLNYKDRIIQTARANASGEADRVVKSISGKIHSVGGMISTFADEAGSGKISGKEIKDSLGKIIGSEPLLMRVAFVPAAGQDGTPAVQAFIFSANKKIKFMQFEHCLIPKLLYWPIFTGLILIINLAYFY